MKRYILILMTLVACVGCESFLDRQPDEALNPELLFKKRSTTLQYLATVYSQQPDYFKLRSDTNPWPSLSDDSSESFAAYLANPISHDTWTAGSNTLSKMSYELPYRGIREATYFMQNVSSCPELTPTEIKWCYNEARFMRAYYYYYMLLIYGPVFLLGDEMASLESGDRERNTWDECVNWVCDELDAIVQEEGLPLEWADPASDWGRATLGAALAVKAKLLVFSASPLCNGNKMYASMKTEDGKELFPQTYDPEKWERAAAACKAVIDLQHYGLVGLAGEDLNVEFDATTAIANMKNVFCTIKNEEIIMTRVGNMGGWRRFTIPASIQNVNGKGYCGNSPTQKLVDAFASSNGYYPVTGYAKNGKDPVFDDRANYSEEGYSDFTHPHFGDTNPTYNMYVDREPRFYVNIIWSGRRWYHGSDRVEEPIQLYYTGKDGEALQGQDAPQSGYVAYKFHDKSIDVTKSWGNGAFPIIRYADILLLYAEALNECDPGNPDILKYLNLVRVRAGVPKIGVGGVYVECIGNQEQMRELIRRERRVELCYEYQRYFDCRRWLTAKDEFGGWVYGMNTKATSDAVDGDFWKRTVLTKDNGLYGVERKFTDRCYFFPIPYDEAVIVKGFTQNYGW